jgi:hypothetical protein
MTALRRKIPVGGCGIADVRETARRAMDDFEPGHVRLDGLDDNRSADIQEG